ncbi:MAG: hypothetical protein M0R06_02205 [Sphaerochaeta sp.]|jgi:hypothetical protein|nr:hypothetical protein [Sphaerochaeta sp.]
MSLAWQIVFGFGALGGLTFIIGYARKARGRWYRYQIGWHLMVMTVSITAALGSHLWQSIDGIISERIWFGIVALIGVALWWRVVLLYTTNDPPE